MGTARLVPIWTKLPFLGLSRAYWHLKASLSSLSPTLLLACWAGQTAVKMPLILDALNQDILIYIFTVLSIPEILLFRQVGINISLSCS